MIRGAAFFAASILGAPTFASAVYALGAFASASSPFLAPASVTSASTLAYISTYASAPTTDAFATGWDHFSYLCTNSGVDLAADPIPVWTIAEEDVASKPHPFLPRFDAIWVRQLWSSYLGNMGWGRSLIKFDRDEAVLEQLSRE